MISTSPNHQLTDRGITVFFFFFFFFYPSLHGFRGIFRLFFIITIDLSSLSPRSSRYAPFLFLPCFPSSLSPSPPLSLAALPHNGYLFHLQPSEIQLSSPQTTSFHLPHNYLITDSSPSSSPTPSRGCNKRAIHHVRTSLDCVAEQALIMLQITSADSSLKCSHGLCASKLIIIKICISMAALQRTDRPAKPRHIMSLILPSNRVQISLAYTLTLWLGDLATLL